MADTIPVLKPLLPTFSKVKPYLERIDETRKYSNFGPLEGLLTVRFAELFGLKESEVLLASSGTLALMGAVVTESSVADGPWAVPAWTFVASAHAVVSAGKAIEVCDISPNNWRLDPTRCSIARKFLVTLPFGDSPPSEAQSSGPPGSRIQFPTIYDGASCFDAFAKSRGKIPVERCISMISLHATKLVSTGEGAVLVGDESWITEIKKWINFGFFGTRSATRPAVNAKMSEYNAAVGLASLDEWQSTRSTLKNHFSKYKELAGNLGLELQPSSSKNLVTSTVIMKVENYETKQALERECASRNIETRDWWGPPLTSLDWIEESSIPHPVATDISSRTLGLPLFVDMDSSHFEQINNAIAAATLC